MDRYLLTGSLGLLIFQVLFLLADLGLLGQFNFGQSIRHDRTPIGKMLQKRQDVKRKSSNSLIWEDSNNNQILYNYDSVLTLDDSGAELELKGDIKLNVHENTLVVLEPIQENDNNDLRLRFQKGLFRARSTKQRMSFGSGDWVIDANSGSNLSIRALDEEKFEVEVKDGQVNFENRKTGEVFQSDNGDKLTVGASQLLLKEQVSDKLKIISPSISRVYTHNFPTPVEIEWVGEADSLQILRPNRKIESFNIIGKQKENAFLFQGTYVLSVKKGNEISQSFTLELIAAPKIKYLHPLPRNRVDILQSEIFSWFQVPNVKNYYVLFKSLDSTQWEAETKLPYTTLRAPEQGYFKWQVEAEDIDGYRIPSYYSLPIYFTDDPLDAPVLNSPSKRKPANEKNNKDKSSFLQKIIHWLLPSAHAEPVQREIVFTWYPVPGADFYIIEVSEHEDFIQPLVIKKVSTEEFSWAGFKDKKYYWRVAAGQSSGRMGIFSEPSEFDVNLLKTLNPKDLSPGVRYVEAPKVTPTPTPVPSPTPTPTPVAKKEEPKLKKPKVQPPTKYSFSVGVDYLNIDQENDDLEQAKFTGLAGLSLQGSKTWWWRKSVWITELDLQALAWQAKDEEELPFQEDINTFFLNFRFFEEDSGGGQWGYSLLAMPIAERADLESVKSATTLGIGGFYAMKVPMDRNLQWNTSLDLHYGDSIWFAGWTNRMNYYFDSDSKTKKHMGLNLDLRFGAGGEDASSFWSRFGISYGWDW